MKAITRIAAFVAIGISALATAYGDVLNSSRQATARIIRADEIDTTPVLGEIPDSTTGVLLSADGYVLTSNRIMRPQDAQSGVEYLVLFPEIEAEGGNVSGVKAYRGVSSSSSGDNKMLVIKIDNKGLPNPVTIYDSKVGNEKLGPEFAVVGYPLARTNTMLPNTEDKTYVIGSLQGLLKTVRKIRATRQVADGTNAAFMTYMTPHKEVGQITSVAGQDGRQSLVSHTVNSWDEGAAGAPMLSSSETSYLIAMFMDNAQALDAQAVLSTSKTNNVPVKSWPTVTRKIPWMLMGASACGLVSIVIIYMLLRRRHRGRKPLLRLRGEQGEQYILTTRDVCHGVLLGRSSKAKCRFAIPSVSGKHARLRLVNKRVIIEDVGSKGGTTVNGDPIAPGKIVKVHDGDIIKLADYTVTVNSMQ